MHRHRCWNWRCGATWWHDPEKYPSSAYELIHTCPGCGEMQYWKDVSDELDVAPVDAPKPRLINRVCAWARDKVWWCRWKLGL